MSWASLLATTDRTVQDVLGSTVTYSPGSGAAVQVPGIFDSNFLRSDAGETGVVSSGPAVFLRLSDLPTDPEVDAGAHVTIDGVVYRIREPQKDGQGGVFLHLWEA